MGASFLVSIGPTRCRCAKALQLPVQVSSLALIPHQLVERDRQIAHAFAGRMIDRIRHGRRGADDADFADAFDTERIDLVVLLLDEDDIDRVHVRIHRHMIVGEIMAHEAPEPVIGDGLLMQRHADAADDGAENLAARSFGLRMRPAATALTTRVTRMTPSCSSTLTSANTAECVECEYLLRSFGSALASFSIRSALLARIASATETSRLSSCLCRILPSANTTSSSFAPASGDRAIFCASPSNSFWTARQAAWMAEPTDETVNDPPSTGASGSAESPSFAVTFSIGTPSISAAS